MASSLVTEALCFFFGFILGAAFMLICQVEAEREKEKSRKQKGESPDAQVKQKRPPQTPKLPGSFDARDWADGFVRTVRWKPSIATDKATMTTWFAAALMAGYDAAKRGMPADVC